MINIFLIITMSKGRAETLPMCDIAAAGYQATGFSYL